jgi:hypothetical protein
MGLCDVRRADARIEVDLRRGHDPAEHHVLADDRG